jgi:hypothetical protein
LATLRDTDEWAYATVAATQAFDQGQNRNVAGASLPAGGRRRRRRSRARADGLTAPLDSARRSEHNGTSAAPKRSPEFARRRGRTTADTGIRG